MGKLLVHTSPHIRGPDSTPKIMWSVVAALVPALVASGYFFGYRAYLITAVAVASAVITEAAIQLIFKKPVTVGDGSAAITGLLLGFCLPPHCRLFVPAVGSVVAIAIAKQCFGGLGYNIWNPALIGRAFVYFSFQTDVIPSKYPLLSATHFLADVGTAIQPSGVDAVSSASPLAKDAFDVGMWGRLDDMPSLWDCFVGNIRGSIGETSALLLIIGAIYLIYKGYVRWPIPVFYIVTVAVLSLLLPLKVQTGAANEPVFATVHPFRFFDAVAATRYMGYHLFCGGLMLGALFMATDMVTSPLTTKGQMIFAIGCGTLTMLIRLYGGMPEGVCFAILLMNTAVPLIDRWTQPRIFGTRRQMEKVQR